jgi:hypothetical protein
MIIDCHCLDTVITFYVKLFENCFTLNVQRDGDNSVFLREAKMFDRDQSAVKIFLFAILFL